MPGSFLYTWMTQGQKLPLLAEGLTEQGTAGGGVLGSGKRPGFLLQGGGLGSWGLPEAPTAQMPAFLAPAGISQGPEQESLVLTHHWWVAHPGFVSREVVLLEGGLSADGPQAFPTGTP